MSVEGFVVPLSVERMSGVVREHSLALPDGVWEAGNQCQRWG